MARPPDDPLPAADDGPGSTTGDDPLRTGPYQGSSLPTSEWQTPPRGDAHATPAGKDGAAAVRIPGYEVLGLLGRGGMGVVYKARHLTLKRVVALKMVLAGAHAAPAEIGRFQTEAEAVARLSHPNIVPIYEVGQADGLPYLALEFVEGGSLAKKLAEGPLPPREAARLVEALAGAMHLAHSRNIVHRDLKPANVLLTLDGTPKISDFGLARRLDDDDSRTEAGAVLGTPGFMSPEQAGGKAHQAGPPADVYALGAILYVCLTGRPPLWAATVLEMLEQVRSREPAPPSRFRRGIPRDAETICLKCLAKEPERRYPSARELGDDLGRFLRGEPIAARPVGAVGRTIKWCRRRPVVAGLLAAALLLFLLAAAGAGLSLFFGFQAQAARLQVMDTQFQEAEKRRKMEVEHGEQMEDALAESLLDSLGRQDGPLNPSELSSLWRLARVDSERVRLVFFDKALAGPEGAARLDRRVSWAVHAAVGLDPARRDRVLALATKRLNTEDLDPAVRRACVDVGLALETPDPAFARAACGATAKALAKTSDPGLLSQYGGDLAALAPWLGPDRGGDMPPADVRVVLAAMTRTRDANALTSLDGALDVLIERLPPEEAAEAALRAARLSLDAAPSAKDARLLAALVLAADRLMERLPPAQTADFMARVAPTLIDAVRNENAPSDRTLLFAALGAAARRLTPEQAARLAQPLLDGVNKDDPAALARRAGVLAALASRLPPDQTDAAARRLVPALLDAATQVSDYQNAQDLLVSFTDLVRLLPIAQTDAAAQRLLEVMKRNSGSGVRLACAEALNRLAERLPPDRTADVAGQAIQVLLDALSRSPNPLELPAILNGLHALAPRLSVEKAAGAAAAVLDAMSKANATEAKARLAQALGLLNDRLTPEQADRAAQVVCDSLLQSAQMETRCQFAETLDQLATRIPPELAAALLRPAAEAILSASDHAQDAYELSAYARALAVLARRLPRQDAADMCRRCADPVLRAVARDSDRSTPAEALAVLAERLAPAQATDFCRTALPSVVDDIDHSANASRQANAATALADLTRRLPPDETAPIRARAAEILLDDLSTHRYAPALGVLSDASAQQLLAAALARLVEETDRPQLIALLKRPTCVGPGRLAVLRELAHRRVPPATGAAIATAGASPFPIGVLASLDEPLYPDAPPPLAAFWETVDWLRRDSSNGSLFSPPRRTEHY